MSTYNPFDWRSNNGKPSIFAADPKFAHRPNKATGAPPPLTKGSEKYPNKREPRTSRSAAK